MTWTLLQVKETFGCTRFSIVFLVHPFFMLDQKEVMLNTLHWNNFAFPLLRAFFHGVRVTCNTEKDLFKRNITRF